MSMRNPSESGIVPRIRVCVRKRPPNKKEINNTDIDIIDITDSSSLCVKELKNKVDLTKYIEEHQFTFDNVYHESSTNQQIYLDIVRPMIAAAFNRTKVSCFAYGQTGSGKTYTMIGDPTAKDLKCPGLYLLSSYDVFSYLQKKEYCHLEIWCSFYEIYCNKLYDLLNDKNILLPREDGKGNICIVGLVEKQIISIKNLMAIIDFGLQSRTTGVTGANSDSSRSHAILQIAIKEPNGDPYGKISFIDLAGSERAVDTIDTNKQTKIDGAEINKSLLALKECIRAMDLGKIHKPFRGSKLTLVLRDSFIGNCLTLMIANISPCLSCSEHTLNTLRYADRVKELKRDRDNNSPNKLNVYGPNSNMNDKDKDPSEILAHLLMMPRQHNKTVKYEFNGKNKKGISNNNQKDSNRNQFKPKEAIHINQLIASREGEFKNLPIQKSKVTSSMIENNIPRCSLSMHDNVSNSVQSSKTHFNTTTNSSSNAKKDPLLNNVFNYLPMNNNKQNNLPNSKLKATNNPNTNTNQRNEYISKYKNININSDEDYQKYSNEHDNLVKVILKEEEGFVVSHKTHIDDMVESIRQEMSLLNNVQQVESDIFTYTQGLHQMLNEEENRIKLFRNRLERFQVLLLDQETLASKFEDPNDLIEMYDNKVPNEEINLIESFDDDDSNTNFKGKDSN